MIEIVGGGLIGLSCAWELGRRGIDAVVYEREPLGSGSASWAGAGMLAADGESFPDELWQAIAHESAAMYPAWVAALGGSVDFVAATEASEGQVDPRDLLRELSAKVRVVRRSVASLSELDGEQIVVCAGAWSSQLGAVPAVEPVKGFLLAWDGFAPGTLPAILRDGHTYVLQRRGGRVIAGSTEERIGFDFAMDGLRIGELQLRAERLWTPLVGVVPDDAWCGLRPASLDLRPVLRRLDARTVAAYGHYRNGILLAPWTGRWVADEIQRQLGK